MNKLYAINLKVSIGSFTGPVPWTVYPEGIELAEPPALSCDENGATLRLVVRCDPAVGREMGWIPFERGGARG